MSQIRIVTLFATVIGAAPLPVVAEALSVSRAALDACFAVPTRLERLACYDALLGRPVQAEAPGVIAPVITSPARSAAEQMIRTLLGSPYRSDAGVLISVLDRADGTPLPDPAELIAAAKDDPAALPADVYLALPSTPGPGEAATLVVSCQTAITHLQVYWAEPLPDPAGLVRIYYGRSVVDPQDHEARRFHVRGDGLVIENARGLDSIRLVRTMAATPVTQVSVGDGENVRSAFFATSDLQGVLGMIGQQCGWSAP